MDSTLEPWNVPESWSPEIYESWPPEALLMAPERCLGQGFPSIRATENHGKSWTSTAMGVLETTEQPSSYGAKIDTKNRPETNNQAKMQKTKAENQNSRRFEG